MFLPRRTGLSPSHIPSTLATSLLSALAAVCVVSSPSPSLLSRSPLMPCPCRHLVVVPARCPCRRCSAPLCSGVVGAGSSSGRRHRRSPLVLVIAIVVKLVRPKGRRRRRLLGCFSCLLRCTPPSLSPVPVLHVSLLPHHCCRQVVVVVVGVAVVWGWSGCPGWVTVG